MIDYDAFASLDVAEELSYAALDKITAPGDLVDRALTMTDRATSGIKMPWSKLENLFTLRPGELVLLGHHTSPPPIERGDRQRTAARGRVM